MIRKLCSAVFLCVALAWHRLGAQTGVAAPVHQPTVPARSGIYDARLDVKVEALLSKMTLEETAIADEQYSTYLPVG